MKNTRFVSVSKGVCVICVFVAAGAGCTGSEVPGATGAGGATAVGGQGMTGGAGGMGGSGAGIGAGGLTGSGGTNGSAGTPGTGGTNGGAGTRGTGGGSGTGGTTGVAGATGTAGAGAGVGGAGALTASYFIGADITDQETQPAATRANLLTLMKAHGFNYVRLRTFVDPRAADGYDKTNGFDDIAHTVAFGKQVKDAGMGLLIDFHYSDNWADPGKQCVPIAWQTFTTIGQMATAVHDYTKDAMTQLVAGGARPDMVQIGNEATPGILIHLCDAGGRPRAGIAGYNPVNGALYLYSSTDVGAPPGGGPPAGGWTNLALLLNNGVQGVKEVDPSIKIVLHLDRGNDLASSRNYIQNAMTRTVPFDVFAESCYTNVQGQPADWQATFTALATQFPTLKFMIAEYGAAQRAANDVIYNLPNQLGIGTFNWQPNNLWTRSGANYTVQATMSVYDLMMTDYASRL